jgi:hypothetical protein
MVAVAPARADMVSYFLDQSNIEAAFPDDAANYLRVDVSDDGAEVRFDVTILDSRLLTGSNSGIQKFGFNLTDGAAPITAANILVPSGWLVDTTKTIGGFGNFQFLLETTGQHRESPVLSFFVIDVAGDTPESYVGPSAWTGEAPPAQGAQFFVADVAGFDALKNCLTSGDFGGSTPAAVVPLPATVWLLLSGLGWLVPTRLRRFTAARAA